MANNSDEVKKGKQLGNIVDLLVTAKVELDDLTSEVYTLQRAQKPQESDLRQIGVILGDIVKEIRELKSGVTLSKLGVAMKVPPKLDRKG
jgi:predicted  nucleic acid-binding Zn-ribbon protein